MARKPKRDLTVEEQLARGPLDLPFLMLTMLLLGVGLIMMFSASFATAYYNDGDPLVYIKNQAVYAAAGVVVMFLVSKINYQTFRLLSVPGIVAAILLLVLALSPLGVELNEVKRWVRIGPIQFQPSEVAKVAVILFFATRLSKRDTEKKKKWSRRTLTGRTLERLDRIGFLELVPYGAILMVIALLMLMEPHMSGTLLVLAGGASVLFAAGISLGWFAAGGTLVAGAMWFIITQTPYMTARINLWLDPWSHGPSGRGTAFRRCSPCWPSAPAACWAWGWARADRNSSMSPSRKTTLYSPSWRKSWDSSGRWWCCSCSPC